MQLTNEECANKELLNPNENARDSIKKNQVKEENLKNNDEAGNKSLLGDELDKSRINKQFSSIKSNTSRRSAISDFFQASRSKQKKTRWPCCKMTRGLLLAFVFFVLFALVISWFIFSSDSFDSDEEKNEIIRLNSSFLSLNSKQHIDQVTNKLFVLVSTVLIVLTIISFVFIGAMLHHFKSPDNVHSRSNSTRLSLNLVSSIFTHRSIHNPLYYLERDVTSLDSSEVEQLRHSSKKRKKSNEKRETNRKSKSKSQSGQQHSTGKVKKNKPPLLPPPIIIVNEHTN